MVAFSKLPVMMSDEDVVDKRYENGKIYLVKCKYDDTLVYVGSSHMALDKRFKMHKCDKKCSLHQYVNNDWDNWYIELYENYPCKNKYILELRETEVQRQIASINKNLARRTYKEWYEDNRKKIIGRSKKNYQDNRDKILERTKQYQEDNRDKIAEYKKQYRQDNLDKILEKDKQHYQDNRDKRLEQKKQKITCDNCGSLSTRGDITRHKRSQKCLNYNVGNN